MTNRAMTLARTSVPPSVAAPPADNRQPFTISLTTATSVGLSPRWVQYSGVTTTARAIAETLADLVTMKTRGSQTPTLDREFLAYAADLSRADQVRPFCRNYRTSGT